MLQNLTLIHLFFFLGALLLFGVLEYMIPYKKNGKITSKRRLHNIVFSVGNSMIMRLGLFIPPIAVAYWMTENNYGLFNIFENPLLLEVIIGIIILDAVIYFQHRLFHRNKYLWKIHSMHHSDTFLDTTSALRFHTLEVLISLFLKSLIVVMMGFSAVTVVAFEICLIVAAIFNHSNMNISDKVDKVISKIFVTPKFHQVHHSIEAKQTHSNFGTIFSFWDKIFSSYTKHTIYIKHIGLKKNQTKLSLIDLILLKFK